jgi:hypothetical protein
MGCSMNSCLLVTALSKIPTPSSIASPLRSPAGRRLSAPRFGSRRLVGHQPRPEVRCTMPAQPRRPAYNHVAKRSGERFGAGQEQTVATASSGSTRPPSVLAAVWQTAMV